MFLFFVFPVGDLCVGYGLDLHLCFLSLFFLVFSFLIVIELDIVFSSLLFFGTFDGAIHHLFYESLFNSPPTFSCL